MFFYNCTCCDNLIFLFFNICIYMYIYTHIHTYIYIPLKTVSRTFEPRPLHPSRLNLTNKYLFAISIFYRWLVEDTPLLKFNLFRFLSLSFSLSIRSSLFRPLSFVFEQILEYELIIEKFYYV